MFDFWITGRPLSALSRRLTASNACRIVATFSCDIAYS
jgi:hypothetical protein